MYPGAPDKGEAQNGHTAWKPFVPWGIGTFAQYLKETPLLYFALLKADRQGNGAKTLSGKAHKACERRT